MKKEELEEFIKKLETSNSASDAYFAIYNNEQGDFIKANKEGLELYAAELLKASRDFESAVSGSEKNILPLDYEQEWIDGNIYIQYVDPTEKKGGLAKEDDDDQSSFVEKLIPFGCIAILILMLVCIIIGIITVFGWIF
ncbi:MAG: hypothetical protein ACJ75J_09025 [Cytophagaceae bacterium]